MKILVIDDEPDICEVITISFNLRWPDARVIATGTASKALEACRKESPEIIILDIGLPDADGFDLCKQLRETSESPILILTARNSEIDKVKGLELGADDYITKPFSHLELLARVRAVLRRHRSPYVGVSEPPYKRGPLSIDFGAREIRVGGEVVKLPPIEYSLLYHLVKNPNRVVPHKTLLAKVWGREYVDQIEYLKVHVQRLRSKLERDPQRPAIIVTERGVGYKFVEPA
ncbi:MAG: response regulator transcription factor [Chloroflexi bacterium]|nr:response regulator transcription factor [Chloroflexota bacterium]